jgi:hypothetical protein
MSAAPVGLADLHPCPLGGTDYVFRTPDVYDPPRARRLLTRQRVRRPSAMEMQVASLAGVAAMATATGEAEEGEAQADLLRQFHKLVEPIAEDAIDEPDFERRAEILAAREAVRKAALLKIWPEVTAIHANLERHWPPYAELLADRNFWDEVSRIDMTRLLLVSVGGRVLGRDDDGLVTQAEYRAIPRAHRGELGSFAFGLLEPDETQRKN